MSSVRIGDLGGPADRLRGSRTSRRDSSQRPQRRGNRIAQVGFGIIVTAVIVGLLFIGWFAISSTNLFTIEKVQVNGVEHLTPTEMTDLAAVPANSTLLRVDTTAIESRLRSNPWVKSASVNRLLPDTLELSITERTIAAVVTITATGNQQTENWAIASDGMWLMKIPDRGTDEARTVSDQVYEDADNVLHITDVPYGVRPSQGSYCTDSSVLNALNIVSGLTTSLAGQVTTVSATDTVNTVLTLNNGVQIAFGTADDIRDKERVCLQLMQQYPDQIAYINVRVVSRPTWRAIS